MVYKNLLSKEYRICSYSYSFTEAHNKFRFNSGYNLFHRIKKIISEFYIVSVGKCFFIYALCMTFRSCLVIKIISIIQFCTCTTFYYFNDQVSNVILLYRVIPNSWYKFVVVLETVTVIYYIAMYRWK